MLEFQSPEMLRQIGLVLSPKKRILDLGCGNGALSFALARIFERCVVVGVELSTNGIRDALTRLHEINSRNVAFVRSSALQLPLGDATFDTVVCRNLIHLIENADEAISEATRVLTSQGTMLVEGPCNNADAPFGAVLQTIHHEWEPTRKRFYHRESDIERSIRKRGFTPQVSCLRTHWRVFDERVIRRVSSGHLDDYRDRIRQLPEGRVEVGVPIIRFVATRA